MSWFLGILSGALGVSKWALRGLGKLLGALVDWLLADLRHMVIFALAINLAWAWLVTAPGLRADLATETVRANREAMNAEEWRISAEAWEAELYAFANEVSAQQFAAAEADRANAARVEAEFAALNQGIVDDYEARLAGSRAAAERLRHRLARAEAQPAASGGSLGGEEVLPETLTARCQAFGAADCDGLLRRLPDVLDHAQSNTDQLVALQRYVAGSALIDFGSENAEAQDAGQ